MTDKITKTDAEWQAQMSPAQYRVTRKAGTERPFTGPDWDQKADGTYKCVGCATPLFSSETKFDSGTGWPSFYAPLAGDVVEEREDRGLFSRRTEIVCARCAAHLGHVFPDGPEPTGQRYCMNGTAMIFEEHEG